MNKIILLLLLTTFFIVFSNQMQFTTSFNNEILVDYYEDNTSVDFNYVSDDNFSADFDLINSSNFILNDSDDIDGIKTFDFECSDFFDNTRYYSIAKWIFSQEDEVYKLDEQNFMYRFYNTDIDGTLREINWKSNIKLDSVLMYSDDNIQYFEGGRLGVINSSTDINYIILCGYKTINGDINTTGVPEFNSFGLVAAVILVTLGLVFFRKN